MFDGVGQGESREGPPFLERKGGLGAQPPSGVLGAAAPSKRKHFAFEPR